MRTRLDKAERDVIVSKEESVKLTKSNQDLDKQVRLWYSVNSFVIM